MKDRAVYERPDLPDDEFDYAGYLDREYRGCGETPGKNQYKKIHLAGSWSGLALAVLCPHHRLILTAHGITIRVAAAREGVGLVRQRPPSEICPANPCSRAGDGVDSSGTFGEARSGRLYEMASKLNQKPLDRFLDPIILSVDLKARSTADPET